MEFNFLLLTWYYGIRTHLFRQSRPQKLVVSRGPYLRFLGVTSYNPSHFSIYLYEVIYRVSRNHPINKPSTPSMPGSPALIFRSPPTHPITTLKVARSKASGFSIGANMQHGLCSTGTQPALAGVACERQRCRWSAISSLKKVPFVFFLHRFGTCEIRVFVRISPS